MAYTFIGFFAKPYKLPFDLGKNFICRQISDPFEGLGIFTPNLLENYTWQDDFHAQEAIIKRHIVSFGLSDHDWIFLQYETWAGQIDGIRTIGVSQNKVFDFVSCTDEKSTEFFLASMLHFGIPEKKALNFLPFKRNYW